MGFPSKIKEDVFVACGRFCSICRKFCGLKIEAHHIKQRSEGGEDSFENAIPLCLDCHADMRSYDAKHPKGNKYTESELRRFRDKLYNDINEGILSSNNVLKTEYYLSASRNADVKIYQELISILPWEGCVQSIQNTDFHGCFSGTPIDSIYNFLNYGDNPSFRFLDNDIERIKKDLLSSAIDFIGSLNTMGPVHGYTSQYNIIPTELSEQFQKNEDYWLEIAVNANNKAKCFCAVYCELIYIAREKLRV